MAQKILITEDSPTVLAMIRDFLEGEGYQVVTAGDGQAAIDIAHKEKPDLVVLDLMMPKMDGFMVSKMLKMDPAFKNVPIVILTARASAADIEMGQEVGASAFLNKPFEPSSFLAKIRELLPEI